MKKSLKKLTGIVMIGVLALGALTGCGSQKASAAKDLPSVSVRDHTETW